MQSSLLAALTWLFLIMAALGCANLLLPSLIVRLKRKLGHYGDDHQARVEARQFGGQLLTISIAVLALVHSLSSHQELVRIQNIRSVPRLSATASLGTVYVGAMEGRVDDVVSVPMVVFNNSDSFAHDLIVDLLFADGTGREGSLNEYFRSVNAPIISRKRLEKGAVWNVGTRAISAPKNANELYESGKLKFKVKIQVQWKDDIGMSYRFIELAELVHVNAIESYGGGFWFKSLGSHSSIDEPNEVNRYWGLPFGKL